MSRFLLCKITETLGFFVITASFILIHYYCCSVAKSCLTLRPGGRQYTRLPLSSTISQSLLKFMSTESVMLTISSLATFSFCLQYFPALGSFLMSWLCVLSCSGHVWLCANLWTITCQVPLSMGFSRQEYWSGLPSPYPGHLPPQGLNPCLLRLPNGRQIFHCWVTREAIISALQRIKPQSSP